MTTALLIIDVQQALCTGPDACFDIERVLRNIRAVTAKARAAGAPVIFVQHEENPGALLCRALRRSALSTTPPSPA